jgi:hypothetical protein
MNELLIDSSDTEDDTDLESSDTDTDTESDWTDLNLVDCYGLVTVTVFVLYDLFVK